MKTQNCHCGIPKEYSDCCGRFLSGRSVPQIPEELMRSRYSAFCIRDIEYLISTLYPSKRSPDDRENLARAVLDTQWQGLKVIQSEIDPDDPDTGYVEFSAFYGRPESGQLHERSRFIREKGIWYYLDGHMLPPLKFGRNEPCWCGSGIKCKHCHGRSQ